MLFSPVGVPASEGDPYERAMNNAKGFWGSVRTMAINSAWKSNWSPYGTMKSVGYQDSFFEGFANSRSYIASDEEKEAFKNCMLNTIKRTPTTDRSITMILDFMAWARFPLKEIIP